VKKSRFLFLVSSLSFLVFGLFLLVKPVQAINLFDLFFPPLSVKNSSRQPPKTVLAPEVVSDDAFSNTLKDSPEICSGAAGLSKTWPPKKETVEDEQGNSVDVFVAQDARDLDGEMDLVNLSNNGFRDFHTFLARGEIKCTQDDLDTSFKDLTIAGQGSASRSTPQADINVLRSLLLKQAAESLNQKKKVDTITQDYQVAWSCQGSCTELSKKPGGCRPVTLSEILFGLRSQQIYYTSRTAPPTFPPGDIISKLSQYFGNNCSSDYGCFQNRFGGQVFSPLSVGTYLFMLKQLNYTPKGNVNNRITVIRYDCYNGEKACPSPTIFNRNLPNAAALLSDQAYSASKMINPAGQASLPNTDLCDNTIVNPAPAIDKPPIGIITLFVHGLFKRLAPGETYSHSETNEIYSDYDQKSTKNSAEAEKTYANFVPAATQKQEGLKEKAFSSKTPANQNYPIPDAFNRGDAYYTTFAKLLIPASWQGNSPL